MQVKLNFMWKLSYEDSFWNRTTKQLKMAYYRTMWPREKQKTECFLLCVCFSHDRFSRSVFLSRIFLYDTNHLCLLLMLSQMLFLYRQVTIVYGSCSLTVFNKTSVWNLILFALLYYNFQNSARARVLGSRKSGNFVRLNWNRLKI